MLVKRQKPCTTLLKVLWQFLSKTDKLGDLSVGKQADIISVNTHVLNDISQLNSVNFVMQGGKVLKQ